MTSDIRAFVNSISDTRISRALSGIMDRMLPTNLDIAVTAAAGGVQATAKLLKQEAQFHEVTVAATAADAVALPPAKVGEIHFVKNSGAASMQVFGSGTDTIDSVATATGVAHPAGDAILYVCLVNGNYIRMGGVSTTETFGAITVTSLAGSDSSLGIDGQAAATGGAVVVTGGVSSTSATVGGAASLIGGAGGATGIGGAANVTGAVGGTGAAGGGVNLTGGAGTTSGAGGAVVGLAGAGGTTGAGGDYTLTSGRGGSTSGAAGVATITAGAGGATPSTVTGGVASLVAGASGAGATGTGGEAKVTGGASIATNGAGGAVTFTGGVGIGTGAGGAVNLTGAVGGTTGAGGAITGLSGAGTGTGAGGAVSLTGGRGGATSGAAGTAIITAGAGGATPSLDNGGLARLIGGASGAGTGASKGGAAFVTGGAGASSVGNGGSVVLTAGALAGTGLAGNIIVRNANLWSSFAAPEADLGAGDDTITVLMLQKGYCSISPTDADTLTTPTGAEIDAAFALGDLAADDSFDFCVANRGTGADDIITMTAGGGGNISIVGIATIQPATSSLWRFRRTTTGTYIVYKIAG